jgi:hypothetical protein
MSMEGKIGFEKGLVAADFGTCEWEWQVLCEEEEWG